MPTSTITTFADDTPVLSVDTRHETVAVVFFNLIWYSAVTWMT